MTTKPLRLQSLTSGAVWCVAIAVLLLASAPALAQGPQLGAVSSPVWSDSPGTQETLTFTATYPTSTSQLEFDAVMNTVNSGPHGCFFSFFNSSGYQALFLFDDAAYTWSSVGLGTAGTVSNSHCTISGASTVSYVGGALTLNLKVTFLSSWAGCKLHFFAQALDDAAPALGSKWQQLTDPSSSDAAFSIAGRNLGPPQLGTITLPNGTNTSTGETAVSQPIQLTTSDPNGWDSIDQVNLLISSNHNGINACFMVFFPYLSQVYLFADDESYWTPVHLQSWDAASNSSCSTSGQTANYSTVNSTTASLTVSPVFRGPATNYFAKLPTTNFAANQPLYRGAETADRGSIYGLGGSRFGKTLAPDDDVKDTLEVTKIVRLDAQGQVLRTCVARVP